MSSLLQEDILKMKEDMNILKEENIDLRIKLIESDESNRNLQDLIENITRQNNEQQEKMRMKLMEISLYNSNLEIENFELRKQIEMNDSRTIGSHFSERSKLSEIPSIIPNKPTLKPITLESEQLTQKKTDLTDQLTSSKTDLTEQLLSDNVDLKQNNQVSEKIMNLITQNDNSINITLSLEATKEQNLQDIHAQVQQLQSNQNIINEQDSQSYFKDEDIISQDVVKTRKLTSEEELNRQSCEFEMRLESNNDFHSAANEILVDLNLQLSVLMNDKLRLQQQVNELEDIIDEQYNQNVLLTAENKELLEKSYEMYNRNNKQFKEFTVIHKTNEINEIQDDVAQADLQWCADLSFSKEKDRKENEKQTGVFEISYDKDEQKNEDILNPTSQFTTEQYNNNQNILLHTSDQIEGEKTALILALNQQVQELTQKISIISQKFTENEKSNSLDQENLNIQLNQKSIQLIEKQKLIETLSLEINSLNKRVSALQDEIEIQKIEFDSNVDDLYSAYQSHLEGIKENPSNILLNSLI